MRLLVGLLLCAAAPASAATLIASGTLQPNPIYAAGTPWTLSLEAPAAPGYASYTPGYAELIVGGALLPAENMVVRLRRAAEGGLFELTYDLRHGADLYQYRANGFGPQLLDANGLLRWDDVVASAITVNVYHHTATGLQGVYSQVASRNASVAIVPEPGTWIMLIAGFGLIGGMLRLRRRPLRVPD